jgi:hypothetical protein
VSKKKLVLVLFSGAALVLPLVLVEDTPNFSDL